MSAIEVRRIRDAVDQASTNGLVQALEHHQGGVLVALPAERAADALALFLESTGVRGAVIHTEPTTRVPGIGRLGAHRWAVQVPRRTPGSVQQILLHDDWFATPTARDARSHWWVFPRYCLRLHRSAEASLRQALDLVSPEPVDAAGVPLPWVPARPPTTTLGSERSLDDDIETVRPGPPLAPLLFRSTRPLRPDDDGSIRDALRRICAQAGFGDVPLLLKRVDESRDGFVAGRIWMSTRGPERIRIEVGPNADAAEIWATLTHEVAHGLAPGDGHGRVFKQALVDLASGIFGLEWFQIAQSKVTDAHAALDCWIAVGIRAAINNGAVPTEATGDEEQLARVVGRIQKLRRLARSQAGRPEGRAACAKANDLLVRWDLGAYNVRLSEGIHDEMCDRWVVVGKRSVWRRQLAFQVAEYCGVFCLSRKSKGWMHFFGRHADVVTAQWFYEIWEAHIVRAADAHIVRFKQGRARGHTARSTRSERVNFCDSAVLALSLKLQHLQDSHDAVAEPDERITTRRERAETFAGTQFQLRGRRWAVGVGKRVTMNAAGVEAGRNAPMGRGVGGPTGVKGMLTD